MRLITFYRRPVAHLLVACLLQPIGICVTVTSNAILQQPPHVTEDVEAHVGRRVGSNERSGRCAGTSVVGAPRITCMSSQLDREQSITFFLCFYTVMYRFSVANDADFISGPGCAVATGENGERSSCSSGSSIGDDAEIDFSPLDALASAIGGEGRQLL
jgi:hypothetical protein